MKRFYSFRQSNSGGFYLFDTREVIVEADSLAEAESIAESYSDVYSGMGPHDCDCCGPRWDYPWDNESFDTSVGVGSWESARKNKIRIIRK